MAFEWLELRSSHLSIFCRKSVEVGVDSLPHGFELLMLAREAVQNALRHAQARRVVLQLAHRPDGLLLSVSDDGRGLPAEPAPGHWGMQGMRERAAQLGARLSWEPVPDGGTRVVLWVPALQAYGEAGDAGAMPGRALWRRLTGG